MHSQYSAVVVIAQRFRPCLQAQAAPALPCGSTQGALGGYTAVKAQDEQSNLAQTLAPAAWQAFVGNNSITGCDQSTVIPASYNVTQACKQAGCPLLPSDYKPCGAALSTWLLVHCV